MSNGGISELESLVGHAFSPRVRRIILGEARFAGPRYRADFFQLLGVEFLSMAADLRKDEEQVVQAVRRVRQRITRSVQKEMLSGGDSNDFLPDMSATTAPPLDSLLKEELKISVERAFAQLSLEELRLAYLRVFEERTLREIASELNISLTAAYQRWQDVIKTLRLSLSQFDPKSD